MTTMTFIRCQLSANQRTAISQARDALAAIVDEQEAQLLLKDRAMFVSFDKKYFRLWPI